MKPKKKMGRPTTNPKNEKITVRLDKECVEILEKYTAAYGTNKMETVRRGIKKLKDDLPE